MIWIGALFTGTGLFIMLMGAGIAPIPGGPESLHAPYWVAFLAGLPFFAGGLSVLLQGLGGADASGKLPPDAPAWMPVAQRLLVLAIFASFAAIGTWIALFGESGQFSGSFMPFSIGVLIARCLFGFGALVCWAVTVGMAVSMLRGLTAMRARAR